MVHAQSTVAKHEIVIHYSFGTVVHAQTNMINLQVHPYNCCMMQHYSVLFGETLPTATLTDNGDGSMCNTR